MLKNRCISLNWNEGKSAPGFSLIELLVVVAVGGLLLGVSLPALGNISRKRALTAASSEIRSIFHLVRSRAIAKGRNSGVKFRQSGGAWVYSIYDDGDGDGVRNDDIARGIDRRVTAPLGVLKSTRAVRIGLSGPIPDPDTGRILPPGTSPVRFNRSTLCAFSMFGSGTPGSIFITSDGGGAALVRVFGATGRIRVLRLNRATRRWESR